MYGYPLIARSDMLVANPNLDLALAIVDLCSGQLRSSDTLRLTLITPLASELPATTSAPMLLPAPPRHVPCHARHAQFLPRLPCGSARCTIVIRRSAILNHFRRGCAKQRREKGSPDRPTAITVATSCSIGGM